MHFSTSRACHATESAPPSAASIWIYPCVCLVGATACRFLGAVCRLFPFSLVHCGKTDSDEKGYGEEGCGGPDLFPPASSPQQLARLEPCSKAPDPPEVASAQLRQQVEVDSHSLLAPA